MRDSHSMLFWSVFLPKMRTGWAGGGARAWRRLLQSRHPMHVQNVSAWRPLGVLMREIMLIFRCINYQCSPESLTELDKVADGGKCHSDESCQSTSRCLQGLCAPRDAGSSSSQVSISTHILIPSAVECPTSLILLLLLLQTNQYHPGQQGKYPAGSFCTQMADCETACIHGRCATSSRFNPQAIADGGICDQQPSVLGQCKSGQCLNNVCSASYADRLWVGALAAGVPCSSHQMCYSGYCASGKCSSDSAAPPMSGGFGNMQRNRGQVAAGGLCHEDVDCYSGYCELETMCGPDGPKRGTLASGAICTRDNQCYSGYCFQRRCVAAAVSSTGNNHGHVQYSPVGKVAPGGRCASSDLCGPGTSCLDTYCKSTDPHAQSVMSQLQWTRPSASSAHWNATCWHNAQCTVGRCLENRCAASWFLAEKYASSSPVHRLHSALLVLGVIVIRGWLL